MIDLVDCPFDRPVLLFQDGNALFQRGEMIIQIVEIFDVRSGHMVPFQNPDGDYTIIV